MESTSSAVSLRGFEIRYVRVCDDGTRICEGGTTSSAFVHGMGVSECGDGTGIYLLEGGAKGAKHMHME